MPGTPGSSRSGRTPSRSPSGSPAGRGGNNMSSPHSRSSRSSESPSPSPVLVRGSLSTPPRGVGWGFGGPPTSTPPQNPNRGGSPLANIFRLDGSNPPTRISGRGWDSSSSSPQSSSSREQSLSPSPQPGNGRGAPASTPWEFAPDIGLAQDSRYYGNSNQPVRMTARQRGRGLGYGFERVPTSSPSSPTSSSSVPSPRTPPAKMSKRAREGSTPPSGAGPSKKKQ